MDQDTQQQLHPSSQQTPNHHDQNSAKNLPNTSKPKNKNNKRIIDSGYAQMLNNFLQEAFSPQLTIKKELDQRYKLFVKEHITPLNNQHSLTFYKIFNEAIISKYQLNLHNHQNHNHNKIISDVQNSIETSIFIIKSFKECSVSTPIIVVVLQSFQRLWQQYIEIGKKQNKYFEEDFKSKVIKVWKHVPYTMLEQFLKKFDLVQSFTNIDEKQQLFSLFRFLKYLAMSFFESKIQQTCFYYTIYKKYRKITQQTKIMLDKFEYEQIIPRITKKDQLFTDYVVKLLKIDRDIASKVFQAVSIKQQEKLVELIQDDITKHPRVIKRAMKRHYNDWVSKHKQWYIIEDKISFSRTFIKWYAQQLINEQSSSQNEQSQNQNTKKTHYHVEEAKQISQSLLYRIKHHQDLKQIIQNPIYKQDSFMPFQLMVQHLNLTKTTFSEDDYIKIEVESVIFIDKIDQLFYKVCKIIEQTKIIGFDTQFIPIQTRFQQSGVSIIQLSSENQSFIFDYHAIRKEEQFINFFVKLMENQVIIKVGHTISSDLQYLNKNFSIKMEIRNFIDLTHLVKKHYPQQIYTSLAFMTTKFLKKRHCKYQQRGNWLRRPLKKTQLYYAALDARICVLIYNKIHEVIKQKPKIKEEVRQTNIDNKSLKQQKLQYTFNLTEFPQFMENPLFLVDNMLKKLCSTLRNYGLDAQYISVKDYQLSIIQSKKEKRIIVTRDSKMALNKHHLAPIYLLKQKSDTFFMFKQLVQVFKIDLNKFTPLSRCVKCNNPELLDISSQQARKQINFLYQETKILQYWRCSKCRQIYWQGGQFEKAMNKFSKKIQNEQMGK